MRYEKSCGAVVFTEREGEIKYLIISSLRGIYGFPKGHTEAGETEVETALREVLEETGLRVQLIEGFRTTDRHLIGSKADPITKDITYFLGRFDNQKPVFQKSEISGTYLVTFDEALNLFQYESPKRILKEANDYLLELRRNEEIG